MSATPRLPVLVDSSSLNVATFQARENTFRDTSESTNSRVLWWSVIQTCALIAIGIWQIKHLQRFFKVSISTLQPIEGTLSL